MNASIEKKSKNQLVEELSKLGYPNLDHEKQKMAILVRCTEDLEESLKSLEDSMNSNANSSNNLADKVMWLNTILTVATVIGTFIAVYKLFYP